MSEGFLAKRKPGFFFGLGLIYLLVLVLLIVGRDQGWWGLDEIPDPIGGFIPLGVPWFGALGAVLISMYGVFDHNHEWDARYNLWHVARPFVGMALAAVAYMAFIAVINATGVDANTGEASIAPEAETAAPGEPGAGTDQQDPWSLVPYYVLAFVVGFREQTFRDLIKRAADTLLGPGTAAVMPVGMSALPSPIVFPDTAVGDTSEVVVTVRNTGTGNLVVDPPGGVPPGAEIADGAAAVFQLRNDLVSGAVVAPEASATLTVAFTPPQAQVYEAQLLIRSNAGVHRIAVRGEGAPPAAGGP
jgi:hypothetical protein